MWHKKFLTLFFPVYKVMHYQNIAKSTAFTYKSVLLANGIKVI